MYDPQQAFIERFTALQRSLRRTHGLTALGCALLALLGVIAVIAAIDYSWELARPVRMTLLGVSCLLSLGWLARAVWVASQCWGSRPTAAALEQRYPELGQRVRTTVQFSGRDLRDDEGVMPSLIEALLRETSHQVEPLEVEEIAPRGRMWRALGLAGLAGLLLGLSLMSGWEWNVALRRTLGAELPFTTVRVQPGESVVDAGESVRIDFGVSGRPRQDVKLLSRATDDAHAEWDEETFDMESAEVTGERSWSYRAILPRLEKPTEYRVVAGPAESPTYRVDVRNPLEIKQIQTTLEPPAYTGLGAKTTWDGNLTGLAGSRARIEIELDRVPASAEAVLTRVGPVDDDEEGTLVARAGGAVADAASIGSEAGSFRYGGPPVERSALADESPVAPSLTVNGNRVRLELVLEHDLTWSLVATSRDGTSLPENRFRVRVQQDQPPQVTFQEPAPELDVHSLAEVLMRIRASDDYGLSRTGIVFQINNGEEHTLLEEDFAATAEAVAEVEATGRFTPRTRASLERVLPLEFFSLTQKDSVMYYAFAEDNFPDGPQRAESDLRFIDVRPFRMQYRELEPGEAGAGLGRRRLTSLEELIRRQRYMLNRTVKLGKRSAIWGERELGTVDRLIEYQGEIAALTRELGDRLREFGISQEVETLFQAENSMLAAVDSLSVGNFDSAVLQEKDAQQYLVEARNRLQILLMNHPGVRRALARADARLRQKLRRKLERDELARTLFRRLRQLANNQVQTSGLALALADGMAREGRSLHPGQADRPSTAEEAPDQAADDGAEATGGTGGPGSGTMTEAGIESNGGRMKPEDLEERQYDAVAEAQDILDRLGEVIGLTELVRQRMQSATAMADEAAGSLSRGETRRAAGQTADAGERFDELARQVEALIAREVSDRLAATRNLTAQLSRQERDLLGQLRSASGGSDSADESSAPTADLAGMANRMRERAMTVDDVLSGLAKLNDPDAGDVADRVAEIAERRQVPETLKRVSAAAERLQDPDRRDEPELSAELEDTAERLELTAAELDRLLRSMVMPRMARLRDLEERVTEAREQMELQETTSGIAAWNRMFEELLRELDETHGGGATREELLELVEQRPLPGADQWELVEDGVGYTGPADLRIKVQLLAEELRRQIHELILTDILADRDEATPPEYEALVDKYFEALARER